VVTVTATATGSATLTRGLTYTINPGTGPVISGQPAAQIVCAGANASFSISSASATSFQWQLSTDGGSTWNNIGGATATTYSIGSAQPTDAGLFRCVASGQCGDDGEGTGGHQLPPEDRADCLATKPDHGIPHRLAAAFYAAQRNGSIG